MLENDYGLQLPRWLQVEFAKKVQARTEAVARELQRNEIWETFEQAYLNNPNLAALVSYKLERNGSDQLTAVVCQQGKEWALEASGKGSLHALSQALQTRLGSPVHITEYSEHALSSGSEAKAATYLQVQVGEQTYAGVAISEDTVSANLNALLAAVSPALLANNSAVT